MELDLMLVVVESTVVGLFILCALVVLSMCIMVYHWCLYLMSVSVRSMRLNCEGESLWH